MNKPAHSGEQNANRDSAEMMSGTCSSTRTSSVSILAGDHTKTWKIALQLT